MSRIYYYGAGGANAEFVKEECSSSKLVATARKITKNESMEVLTYFPSAMMDVQSGTNYFAEKGVSLVRANIDRNLAEENDYAGQHSAFALVTGAVSAIFILGLALLYWHVYRRYDRELRSSFEAEYYRELPAEYPPAEMGYLYREEEVTVDDLNATLMDLIRKKYISVDLNGDSLTNKNPNYRLTYHREMDRGSLSPYERYLLKWYFDIIAKKADTITLNEIDAFVRKESNANQYNACNQKWIQMVKEEGRKRNFFDRTAETAGRKFSWVAVLAVLIALLDFYSVQTYSLKYLCPVMAVLLAGAFCFIIYARQIRRRTKQGNEDFVRWRAFKKFLEDFSQFPDYPVPGIVVWEQYLVYATSFGIADLVEKQLRTKFSELGRSNEFDTSFVCCYSFHYYMQRRLVQTMTIGHQTVAAANAKRMASSGGTSGHGGFGGGSFHGGGGGHSGVR